MNFSHATIIGQIFGGPASAALIVLRITNMCGEKYNPACGDVMQLLVHVALSFYIDSCFHTNYYFIKLEILEEIQILWSLVSLSVLTILFIISYENSRAAHALFG